MAINDSMSKSDNNIEEDRFIGAWYFKPEEMNQIFRYTNALQLEKSDINVLLNPLCDKLCHYLRQDVFRNNPGAIFREDFQSLYKVREALKEKIAIQDILNIELPDKSYVDVNDISFILSREMERDISLRELKKQSELMSWKINDDFIIDVNMTYNKAGGSAPEDEIVKLIEKSIFIIEEEVKRSNEDKDTAVKEFREWIIGHHQPSND